MTAAHQVIYALIPPAAFVVFLVVHGASLKIMGRGGLFGSLFAGLAGGYLFILLAYFFLFVRQEHYGMETALFLFSNLLFYSCLWYCFFIYVSIGESSVRIRILHELASRAGSMTRAEILEKYNNRIVIRKRLERLICKGLVVKKGGRYFLAESLTASLARLFAAFLSALRIVIHGRERADRIVRDFSKPAPLDLPDSKKESP